MLLTMIMSLFCSILIGLAPCNSDYAALDQENTVEEKVKNNYINQYGYLIISPYELLVSNNFYNNFVSNISGYSNVGDTYILPPYYTDNMYSIQSSYLNADNPDNSVTNYGNLVTSITFTLNDSYSLGVNRFQDWNVKLTFNNIYATYRVGLVYNGSTSNPYFISSLLLNAVYENYTYFIVLRSNAYLYDKFAYGDDFENGYNSGYQQGYDLGYTEGQVNPTDNVRNTIYNEGKQAGDAEGYQRAISQGSTAATIFSGIVTVGLLPVNVLLTMFQYEVFGINIAGLVSGFLTIAVVIIVIRFVTGKKND